MITAEQARKRAEEVTTARDNDLLNYIEQEILKAIKDGKRQVKVWKELSNAIHLKLTELGYKVTRVPDPEPRNTSALHYIITY